MTVSVLHKTFPTLNTAAQRLRCLTLERRYLSQTKDSVRRSSENNSLPRASGCKGKVDYNLPDSTPLSKIDKQLRKLRKYWENCLVADLPD